MNNFVDLHSHIIFGVDDGSKSIEHSIDLIKEEVKNGVKDIILTPHYRPRIFNSTNQNIIENFNLLKDKVKELNIDVNLYLGREIYYSNGVLEEIYNKNIQTINNTNIVLMEFSYTEPRDICDIVHALSNHGFRTIIAHIERYQYIKSIDILQELKEMGAYIQVNASTICGVDGLLEKYKVLHYIRHNLVDFISSDIHYSRGNYLLKAYRIIRFKFGKKVADALFEDNARNLLGI